VDNSQSGFPPRNMCLVFHSSISKEEINLQFNSSGALALKSAIRFKAAADDFKAQLRAKYGSAAAPASAGTASLVHDRNRRLLVGSSRTSRAMKASTRFGRRSL